MTDLQAQGLEPNGLFKERPNSIKTFTGRIDPLDPSVNDINIEDIAHALARQCRYNGHCVGFLSVARHSIWVAQRLKFMGFGRQTQLHGLLHDAAEAYLGDLVRPLKHSTFGLEYLRVEEVLEKMIAEKFGLPFPIPEEVRDADNYALLELELPDQRFRYHGDYMTDEQDFLLYYKALATS